MASENRPGVIIVQQLTETPTITATPALAPCVMAPCYQIIEAVDSTGSLNSTAKHTARYNQASLSITQAEFPDPRANLSEIDIIENTIGVSLYKFSNIEELQRGSNGTLGSAYLDRIQYIHRAAIRIPVPAATFSFDANGDKLVMAIDSANPAATQKDKVYTFDSSHTTAGEVAEVINLGFGKTIAKVVTVGLNSFIQIVSPTFGPKSSITIRGGSAAITKLFNHTNTSLVSDVTVDYRVEGSGLRGQDQENNQLVTPWIEFFRGEYMVATKAFASYTDYSASAYPTWAGHVTGYATIPVADDWVNAKSSAVTFAGSSPDIPLQAATSTTPGDHLWVDGALFSNAEVTVVEETRFKMGTINTSLSTYGSDGITVRVYDELEVNLLQVNSGEFNPKYAYFIAQNLSFGSITPEGTAASVTGTSTNVIPALPAQIASPFDVDTFPMDLTGTTLVFQITEDGTLEDAVTITLAGQYANLGQVATDITSAARSSTGVALSEITCSAVDSNTRLLITSVKTGSDQSISLSSTGSANVKLGFRAGAGMGTAAVSANATGVDEMVAEAASLVGTAEPLEVMKQVTQFAIEVGDSRGTHSISSTSLNLSAAADIDAICELIATEFGNSTPSDGKLYSVGIAVAKITNNGSVITVSSIEGGSTVSIAIGADADGATINSMRGLGLYVVANDMKSVYTSGSIPDVSSSNIVFASGLSINASLIVATSSTINTNLDDLVAHLNTNRTTAGANVHFFHENGSAATSGVIKMSSYDGVVTGFASSADETAVLLSNVTGTAEASPSNDSDTGADLLKLKTLSFYLDDNPYEYEATFTSNSLQDAISLINSSDVVGGSYDTASDSSDALKITSSNKGVASAVEIEPSDAAFALGLTPASTGSNVVASGSGRPNPDFYVDGTGTIVIGANILRNMTTGLPYSIESAFADIYIEYKALRFDVTSSASSPALLSFGDLTTMEAAIGPISTENPLALAAYLCMLNSPTNTINAFGINEVSDSAPMGTVEGYMRALDYLESKEVYAMAPMTDDEYIQQLMSTHVQSMSQPSERGERIALLWQGAPTRAVAASIMNGTAELSTSDNQVRLDNNPSSDLIGAGITDTGSISVDDGVYLELTLVQLGSTSVKRYNVSSASSVLLDLNTTFTSAENADGFYETATLSASASYSSISYALKVRGDKLVVTGTTIPDLGSIAAAAADQSKSYAHRRVFMTFGDSVDVSIEGVVTNVPGYYINAGLAGMIAEQQPQQPFTNLLMTGYGEVYGSDDTFSENQLDVIADGGRYVLVNSGSGIVSRHQRSTAITTIESRELSITKAIDFLAKGLRQVNREFIGRFVITPGFLDQLTMANEGFLRFVVQNGVVTSASMKSLLQSESAPDTVLVEIEVSPAYPCNKIRITIVS